MRLDKFLKVSRLAKRRSEAHEGIVNGRIEKDGRPLKPGYDVKVGDLLVIHYARKTLTVRVRDVPLRVLPSLKPAELYEILSEAREDPLDWLASSDPLGSSAALGSSDPIGAGGAER